ncbi:MAG: hypothetical protein L0287_31325 [Anaerolineae bacterium]|nr:hypothetical protein [Anaerolineae bacterium]
MEVIKLSVWVGEDKRLIIDLPPESPAGLIDVQIAPHTEQENAASPSDNATAEESVVGKRERLRKKLMDAGMLSTAHHAPAGTIPLSPEALLRLGTLSPGVRSTDKLIDEDRGQW